MIGAVINVVAYRGFGGSDSVIFGYAGEMNSVRPSRWFVVLGSAVLAIVVACQGGGLGCDEEPSVRVPFPDCAAGEDGMVIQNEAAWIELCGSEPVDEAFEPIDLETQVIIGVSGSGTGCTVSFDEEICRNDRDETITYRLIVRPRGTCKRTVTRNTWAAIDKPPAGWAIEFELLRR